MFRRLLIFIILTILVCGAGQAQPPADQLRAQAEKGELSAQLALARSYYLGQGVPKDEAEAARWFRKAAEQGEPQSERILGLMYDAGSTGLPKDDVQALAWYRRAAGHGDAAAQNKMGGMYEAGRGGLPRDFGQALAWYRKAAGQGVAAAQNRLGEAYEAGLGGLPQDEEEAVAWYRKAADQNDTTAQNNAARLSAGSVNPKVRDPNAAVYYAEKAVAAKPNSPEFLNTLAQAYALEGQFAKAVSTQIQALSLAAAGKREEYARKLSEYQRQAQETPIPASGRGTLPPRK